ncbi:MAG: hypothetical protein JRG89_13210 [Deltaproteobacteria bacterium]|nr:hypothetical protein [Deltaproteobacteria bacterium]
MMHELRTRVWGTEIDADAIGADPEHFLRALGGPSLIELPGRDRSRLRVISTLLHGNEPSGVRALHRWLGSDPAPATDVLLFIGAVETALAAPGFAKRFLPGAKDLNRIWCEPFEGEEGALARAVLERLRARTPECHVDLHNNTGQNPAYGVTFQLGVPERNLVARYAHRIIHSPIKLGTIVEATCEDWPTVTLECGRSFDRAADDVAYRGTRRILETYDLGLHETPPLLEVVVDPVRVSVRSGIELAFGDGPDGVGLVISREIDRHNFELVPAGTCIGWIAPGTDWPIEAIGDGGRDRSTELFAVEGNRLETRREMIPVMMTTHRENALADCLFYAAWPERLLG